MFERKKLGTGILALLVMAAGISAVVIIQKQRQNTITIEQCNKLGGFIEEGYPAKCVTQDGVKLIETEATNEGELKERINYLTGWQTYANEEFAYEIRFPQNSLLSKAKQVTGLLSKIYISLPDSKEEALTIEVFENKDLLSAEEWLESLEKQDRLNNAKLPLTSKITERREVTISEQVFPQIDLMELGERIRCTYINGARKMAKICYPNESDTVAIYGQILATFKFTNQMIPAKSCKVGGCNGELCLEENAEELSTICLYKPEYECLKTTACEVQENSQCGWTKTEELGKCLDKYQD